MRRCTTSHTTIWFICISTATLHILGYEDYLRSALSNLITNAMKYTPKVARLVLAGMSVTRGYVFSVTDNGIGIEQRHIQRLTEAFLSRGHGSKPWDRGYRFGASNCQTCLVSAPCPLDITSTVGKGSTFTVTFQNLPVSQPNPLIL